MNLESITVVKKGLKRTLTVDTKDNNNKMNKIKVMINKDNCYTIFQDTKVNEKKMY